MTGDIVKYHFLAIYSEWYLGLKICKCIVFSALYHDRANASLLLQLSSCRLFPKIFFFVKKRGSCLPSSSSRSKQEQSESDWELGGNIISLACFIIHTRDIWTNTML